jgi:hypothetical protein
VPVDLRGYEIGDVVQGIFIEEPPFVEEQKDK